MKWILYKYIIVNPYRIIMKISKYRNKNLAFPMNAIWYSKINPLKHIIRLSNDYPL